MLTGNAVSMIRFHESGKDADPAACTIQARNARNAASSLRPSRQIRYQCSPFDTDCANGATSRLALRSSST